MKMSKAQLVETLREIAILVEIDDSFEGSFVYTMGEEPHTFEVQASYRIGNRDGQGGVRLIQ